MFTHTAKKGNWYVDEARAIYIDETTVRENTVTNRDSQNGGLLPPPAAPDGFRGNN
jgi:hypothetical protein